MGGVVGSDPYCALRVFQRGSELVRSFPGAGPGVRSCPVRYTNAFVARQAVLTPTGAWVAGAFLGWWGPTQFPTRAELTAVWTCELEPTELANPLVFDVFLASPDGSYDKVGHVEGLPTRTPNMPEGMPFFFEVMYANLVVNFRMQGLHRFDIRSGDGQIVPSSFGSSRPR